MPRSPHPKLHLCPLVWSASLILNSPLLTTTSWAQSITATPDGTGTIITIEGNTYHIKGGTQAGANLFHSFQDFSLNTGEMANFLSHPGILNILGRVTGGDPSVIDGLLQVTGSNANLYLMNPAGIVLGANAQLNVGGDFFATTADQICFEGGCFNSVGFNNYSALRGSPNTLGFLQGQPGDLLNAGTLEVLKGKSIHLSGGTVVNLGQIVAPGGMATIAAIPGERRVRLSQPGSLLSLEVTDAVLTDGINPLTLPALLTSAPENLNAKVISAPLGNIALDGVVAAEQIDLYAAEQVTPSDGAFIQGDTRVVRFSESGENPNQAVFIDARVDNPETLLFGAEAGTVSQIIEPDEDGVSVISEQLAVISDSVGELESVAIAAEGNTGHFWLGREWLQAENIDDYAASLQSWGETLTANADILLYSCFTALGATGETLVQHIADITGADVAASMDATGSANYEGNWDLEQHTGRIEATNPFTPTTLSNWDGKLAIRTVTNNADLGSGSLREALTGTLGFGGALAAGDTVNFNFSGTITLTGADITWIADNITIDGSGQTLIVDGGGNDRIFNINANNATIQNLTLQNGSITGDGGAIQHSGAGTLQLSHVIVTGNSASGGGAGINSYNGDISLLNSNISGNSAGGDGGGMRAFNGDISLNHSIVTNNLSGGSGGGIHNNNGSVSGTVATIAGNSANAQGGGINAINGGSGGSVTLRQSTVSSNSAGTNGGGMFGGNGAVTLTNTTVSGNQANNDGGGIFINNAPARFLSSTIAFNTADAENNGAGDGGGLTTNTNASNNLMNTILANNRDLGNEAPDIKANFGNTTITYSLVQDAINGITNASVITSAASNLTGLDPLLDPLANNGGPTQTHALASSSPALNVGNNVAVATLSTDQRGQTRIADGVVDLGAYELINASTTTTVSLTTATIDFDYNPLNSLDVAALEQLNRFTRDRVSELLANNQICEAIVTLDQYHTQNLAQYFGRFPAEKVISCTQMQQRLAAESALLYVFAQMDKLHLIALTAEDEPSHYELPLSKDALLAELTHFQHTLTNPVLRRSENFLSSAQQLHQWMVEPLRPEFEEKGIRNILFGLDDGLRMLPIAALHDGEQFLIEQYQTTLIPSFTLTPTHRSQLQDASVLALGISAFEDLAPLPAVPVELASIKRRFPNGTSLRNAQATLDNFQQQLQAQATQIVHLATHGNFQPGQAENSYIQFWDNQLDLKQIETVAWADAAVELLVLSACQTALGDTAMEYGFAGLAVQAQVGAAVAGLWGANDTATLALMSEFYRQLSLGQPKGEALRQAQLALLNGIVRLEDKQLAGISDNTALPSELQELGDRTFWHPYYWSAFTLIGNPW
ncbi:MAG: CHAT domain-containing protein [Spirulina sp. SIO3F2]|nr:CHAT domain-containing protein [Spirulina sp. SIO3F2]